MGFLSKILGSGIGTAVSGVANVVDKFMETPDEKRAAELVMRKLQLKPDEFQVEINKTEAGHKSLFVAGWRPCCGWIAALALFWGWIVAPTLQFIFPGRELPAIEIGQSMSLIMAMLGMGGLRSYEKLKGLTK